MRLVREVVLGVHAQRRVGGQLLAVVRALRQAAGAALPDLALAVHLHADDVGHRLALPARPTCSEHALSLQLRQLARVPNRHLQRCAASALHGSLACCRQKQKIVRQGLEAPILCISAPTGLASICQVDECPAGQGAKKIGRIVADPASTGWAGGGMQRFSACQYRGLSPDKGSKGTCIVSSRFRAARRRSATCTPTLRVVGFGSHQCIVPSRLCAARPGGATCMPDPKIARLAGLGSRRTCIVPSRLCAARRRSATCTCGWFLASG